MKNKIEAIASKIDSELIAIRRHLHQYPELAFEEYQTSAFIQTKLQDWNVAFKTGVAKTGIVAEIKGNNPDRQTFVLRGDMDALPILEENNVEYKSTHEGLMHACGHDVHTTCVLGAVYVLNELKKEFEGTIRVLFQPSEEKLPGGASVMIEEGVLQNPVPSAIIGQHVFPELEVGKVGFRSGMYMASCDELYFTVKGQGGHAALPHKIKDPIEMASSIVLALKELPLQSPPGVPTVLSIGKIEGLGATNVVPNEVKMEGTLRTMNEVWRAQIHSYIKDVAKFAARELGGECEVNITRGYPFLINNEEVTKLCKDWATDLLGEENVVDLEMRMTAEDFSYYTHHVPGCFYRLGVKNEEKGITSPVHTSTFDVDEKCLGLGTRLMSFMAIQFLNQ
jgi:amidohydrolase